MFLRVRMSGDGTVANPRRVELPNWRIIDEAIPGPHVVIEVPDSDINLSSAEVATLPAQTLNGRRVITNIPGALRAKWLGDLDKRYLERQGTFNPDVQ